jgi:uncharacterized protein YggU (UPF0235/DUF167 family)
VSQANQAPIDFLSEALGIPRRNVFIISGLSSRTKLMEIHGVDLARIQQLAG